MMLRKVMLRQIAKIAIFKLDPVLCKPVTEGKDLVKN